jgi:SH3 domain-containing protein
MSQDNVPNRNHGASLFVLAIIVLLTSGCQEFETLKRELMKKFQTNILKIKRPFTPRDGITRRPCSLYQAANENSEVLGRLAAETPVRLLDQVGDWYGVRTRDGQEGYLIGKNVGGEEVMIKTQELRKSIEGMPIQAEGVTKNEANFRLEPGINHEIFDKLPPGKKFEMYERVVTIRHNPGLTNKGTDLPGKHTVDKGALEGSDLDDVGGEFVKKDVWYKIKLEDARVGYVYTHNLKFTPPGDIARLVPFMRIVAWRTVNVTDDPDRGARNNYIAAYAPIGKDPGCDYDKLYLMRWNVRDKRYKPHWRLGLRGILPITNYHFDGKPGFSVRFLHPTKSDKLVLASFVLWRGSVKKVSEEEIPNTSSLR